MARRFRSALIPLALTVLAAGCGVQAAPGAKARQAGDLAMQGATRGEVDDADLTAGARRKQVSTAALAREGKPGANGTLLFPTSPTRRPAARPMLRAAAGPVVAGVLRYPDAQGALIPAANVTVHLEVRGKEVATALTDAEGRWTAELGADLAGKALAATYELGNKRWTINKYRWAGPQVEALAAVNDTGERTIDAGSQNGKAALIHQVWNRALNAFTRENIDIDGWWTRPIGTTWPGSGNYYSFGSVNLTDAEWWDVNGHEIGHAIFFAGFNSASGGGQHKIDECYGADLAWSEGFASFFSGVISIDRGDADAKFQYMVPRRAPIRVENVPDDVCTGHTNEWRAGSALWDLYDTHNDGQDHVALEFKTIWGALVKTQNPGRMTDVRDAFKRIATGQPAEARPGLAAAFAQSGVPVQFQVAR